MKPLNVKENWLLVDTVLAGEYPTGVDVPGWVANYAGLGALADINFFNVRNRTVGLPYNNQDARDQMPYGFYIDSIGVACFATMLTQYDDWEAQPQDFTPDDYMSHIFTNDLPRHLSLSLKINQDERLKTTAMFCPPGYGPHGDSYARGSMSTKTSFAAISGYDHFAGVHTQGLPQLNNRWLFPVNLQVPRRAALSVTLKYSEYARELLNRMWLRNFRGGTVVAGSPTGIDNHCYAGIQVTLAGKRLVQQRAQYHA